MKALLVCAPFKSTEEVNWIKPLNNYLLSVYGNTSEFQDDLSKFNELRKRVQGASVAGDESAGAEMYLDYYSQLELVDLRIPMLIVNKRKLLKFTWSDAFDAAADHTQSALPFEKASVLFNLSAALMKASALKYGESFRTPAASAEDGEKLFKMAIQLMQQAAGVLEYISETFLNGPSADLKPSTVKFLVSLCLAQSQEMFTLKVIDGDLEQKKNSLISKLCASAAKSYDDCYKATSHLANEDGVSTYRDDSGFGITEAGLDEEVLSFAGDENDLFSEYNPDSGDAGSAKVAAHLNPGWIAIFRIKHLYYKSLAHYFQGLQLESTSKFGEAIAYLTKSSQFLSEIPSSLLKSVTKSNAYNIYDLLDNLEYQKDASRIKLVDLTKDNDLIYHDIIPSLVTLGEPKPMNSAKVVPLTKIESFARINEKNYNHFLNHVVPVNIHELLSCYSEEKSQFLRDELDAVDISNEELSSALEFLNLPKALVSVKELVKSQKPLEHSAQESHLDSESLRKVEEISSKSPQDSSNRNRIAQARKNILDIVARCENVLNSASASLSQGQVRDDLIKLKRSLYDSANSDARLFALIDQENSAFYQTLSKGANSAEFKNLFLMPDMNKRGHEPEISLLDLDDRELIKESSSIEEKIIKLENLLNEVNIVNSKKAKLIAELKKEIHEDDISDILLINSRVKSTNEIKTIIFPEEIRKFDTYLKNLNKLINNQKVLLKDVKKLWEDLIANPKVKEIQSSSTFKNELLNEQKAKIDAFYDNNWKKYTAGLLKGVEFYNQLHGYARELASQIEAQTQMGPLNQSMSTLDLNMNAPGGTVNSYISQTHTPQGPANAHDSDWNTSGFAANRLGQQYGNSSANFGTTPVFNTDTGAPQLPPKRPSQASIPGSYGANLGTNSLNVTMPAMKLENRGQSKTGGTGLIYDEPSTYQPNLYDILDQNRG